MKKVKGRGFYGLCCLMISASVLLTACKAGAPDEGGRADRRDRGEIFSDDMGTASTSPVLTAGKTEWVYVPERIEIRDERADYDAMRLIGDEVCYISMNGEQEDNAHEICRYTLTDRKLTGIPIDWKDDGQVREISCYTFDDEQNAWLIVNVYSADYGRFRRFLYKFDPEGNNIFFRDITEQLARGAAISGLSVDGQGRIYIFGSDEGIWLYTDDGSYHGIISYGISEDVLIRGTLEGEDGRYYICSNIGGNEDYCALTEVDFDKKHLVETRKVFPVADWACADSSGQYDLLLYDHVAAYGYDFSTGKKEELFVWQDSDINGYDVKCLAALEDGRYFCAVEDWENDDRSIVLLTKTRAEDAPQRLEMILANLDGGSELTALAVGFNRNNSQYHITVKNYGSLTDLYNALLAGETVDIVDLSGVNIKNLCRKGVFEDLTSWLEESETFGREDFVDGILEAYTIDGTLVGIPDSFRLRTVVGDRSMVGNDAGLSLEGMLELAGSNPGAMPFDGITRDEMTQYLMMFNEEALIDWERGECHFDSELFKAVLAFLKRFPDSVDGEQEDVSLPGKIQNGDVLFAIADMKGLKDFQLYGGIFDERATAVGFPTPDGCGGTLLFADNAFGIVSGSENKSGAWDFIESVLRRKYAEGMDQEQVYAAFYWQPPWQYPSMKKAFSAITDYVMERDKDSKFGTRIYSDGWSFDFHAVTWEEINAILDMVPDATPWYTVENSEILNIINEEAAAYYYGQKGPDDVAGIIQNRVQVYVNENR